jgi:hypothetical protein
LTFGAITVPVQTSDGLVSEIVPEPGVAAVDDVSGTRSAVAAVAAARTASANRARARRGRCVTSGIPLREEPGNGRCLRGITAQATSRNIAFD